MSEEAKPLTAEEEARWRALNSPMTPDERLRLSLILAEGGNEWGPDPDDAQGTLDALDAERAKVEALTASLDRANNNRDMWRAQCAVQANTLEALSSRATAAEAEAAGVRSAVKRARKQLAAVMAFDVKSDRALKAAQETLRAALAKEKPDAAQ